jgi:hypothetical protein
MAFQNSLFWLVHKRSVKPISGPRGPYFPYLDRCPGCRLSGGKFLLCKQKNVLLFNFPIVCNQNLQIKISNNQIVFDWACMPTVYCYLVKLMIADLIRAKSICSQIDSVQPYNKPIIDLACSVLYFLHTKKPRSDISQYRLQTSRSVNKPLIYNYMLQISQFFS